MVMKFMEGDLAGAARLQLEAVPLINALFCEVNPIPVKTALNLMGWKVGPTRMPPVSYTHLIATQECDFLVLDEILGLLDKHIATVDMVVGLLKQKDESMHLILTGNRVDPGILDYVDSVTTVSYTHLEVLKQNQNAPVPVEKQVAILYAVTKGILSRVATEDVRSYEAGLYTWIDSDAQGAAAMQEIRSTGALSAETEEKLKGALEQYTENFVNTRPEK